jgi:hypothetical protein
MEDDEADEDIDVVEFFSTAWRGLMSTTGC